MAPSIRLNERTVAFAYTLDQAKLLADQLERFVTLNRHQLAGHRANLDFWLGEARHVLATIHGFQRRFERMREGQQRWIRDHGEQGCSVHCPACLGPFDVRTIDPNQPANRIPPHQLATAASRVRRAAQRFMVRLFEIGLLAPAEYHAECDRLDGAGLDPADVQ